LTASDLRDRSRFQFREEELELPELGGSVLLRSLSVEEREMLPDPTLLSEIDDKGERTQAAIKASAETFSLIVADPKVSAGEALEFLSEWPAEAFDKITQAYGRLVGDAEEERAAYAEFPGPDQK
jgi:hypothetical protein